MARDHAFFQVCVSSANNSRMSVAVVSDHVFFPILMFLLRICNIASRTVSHCFAKQFGHRTVRGFSRISSSWVCSREVEAGVEVVVETLVAVVVVVGCIHYNSVHYLIVNTLY